MLQNVNACHLRSSRMGSNGGNRSCSWSFSNKCQKMKNNVNFFCSLFSYVCTPTSTESCFRVRSDLSEISKFASGIIGGNKSAATTRINNARRCYKTSISSGYSSHSPLLSVGSCSYYASTSTRDLSYGGLAVIHESETACVPQSIWPSVYHQAENIDYEGKNESGAILFSFKFQKYRILYILSFRQVFIRRVAYVVARVAIRRLHHRRRHHHR